MARNTRGKTTRRTTNSRTTRRTKSASSRRNTASSASKARSLQARKQRRHSDGTFAKGFKQHASPRKTVTPTSSGKSSSKTRTASRATSSHRSSRSNGRGRGTGRKTISGYTPQMKSAESAFKFDCTEATKKKVLKTVTENFSKDEIDKIDRFGKPFVVNGNLDGKNGGYARPTTKDKGESPTIILKTNPSEMTVTHEMVHHMRTVDGDRDKYAKTAYPIDGKGNVKCGRMKGKSIKQVRNAEETATAAEAELRLKHKSEEVSGYWKNDRYDVSGRNTRDSDRTTMRSGGAIREGTNITGKSAVNKVNENYPKTIISSRKEGGESALSTFRKIFSWRSKNKW